MKPKGAEVELFPREAMLSKWTQRESRAAGLANTDVDNIWIRVRQY